MDVACEFPRLLLFLCLPCSTNPDPGITVAMAKFLAAVASMQIEGGLCKTDSVQDIRLFVMPLFNKQFPGEGKERQKGERRRRKRQRGWSYEKECIAKKSKKHY